MAAKKESAQKAQSPELGAGAGFTFEDAVGAYFLSALLDESYAAGCDNRVVSRVAFQQRGFKQPLDDIIVDFRDQHGGQTRLSLQVKRDLTVSAATTNEDFRDVVRDCWRTFKQAEFRKSVDRYGVAVGEIAKEKARDLISLCEIARASVTTSHFVERFADGGNASAAVKTITPRQAEKRSVAAPATGRETEAYLGRCGYPVAEGDKPQSEPRRRQGQTALAP